MHLNARLNNGNSNDAKPVPKWLNKKKKKKKQPDVKWDQDPTPAALIAACAAGICGLYTAACVCDALTKSGNIVIPSLPPWRAHMAITCAGMVSFTLSLYFLEVLGRRSKQKAWKSSASWLPLVALTASASVVHVPTYAVVPIGILCGGWAYRRTRAIR
jgi:hypothetical protein